MKLDIHPPTTAIVPPTFDFLDPIEVIDAMIELRIQLVQLQQQIQALEPTFFAACLMLNQAKIQRERAVISRKFTPASVDLRCRCPGSGSSLQTASQTVPARP